MENMTNLYGKHPQVIDAGKTNLSILLYSPDMDFCMSLRLLFQNRYIVRTTTDPPMLLLMMKEFEPELVIVDGLPTARMKQWLERIREENPRARIMYFYVPHFEDQAMRHYICSAVDAVFSKPVDLEDVTKSVDRLVKAAASACSCVKSSNSSPTTLLASHA